MYCTNIQYLIDIAVAPRAGAWIETAVQPCFALRVPVVAPRAGAWIETGIILSSLYALKSHPVRVRGLKRITRRHNAT